MRYWISFKRTSVIALLDLPVQEFHGYLADFPSFRRQKWIAVRGFDTKREVRDALKQVSLNKSHQTQAARAARRWLRRRQCFTSVLGLEPCGVSHGPSWDKNGD